MDSISGSPPFPPLSTARPGTVLKPARYGSSRKHFSFSPKGADKKKHPSQNSIRQITAAVVARSLTHGRDNNRNALVRSSTSSPPHTNTFLVLQLSAEVLRQGSYLKLSLPGEVSHKPGKTANCQVATRQTLVVYRVRRVPGTLVSRWYGSAHRRRRHCGRQPRRRWVPCCSSRSGFDSVV